MAHVSSTIPATDTSRPADLTSNEFGTNPQTEADLGGARRFLAMFRRSSWAPLCPDLMHELEMGIGRRN